MNHARGAMKLLELRGEEQLKTAAGLEIFTTVRLQVVSLPCSPQLRFPMSNMTPPDHSQYLFQKELPCLTSHRGLVESRES